MLKSPSTKKVIKLAINGSCGSTEMTMKSRAIAFCGSCATKMNTCSVTARLSICSCSGRPYSTPLINCIHVLLATVWPVECCSDSTKLLVEPFSVS